MNGYFSRAVLPNVLCYSVVFGSGREIIGCTIKIGLRSGKRWVLPCVRAAVWYKVDGLGSQLDKNSKCRHRPFRASFLN